MTTTKEATAEQVSANRRRLREMFPPGSTMTTSINNVSRSGMTRAISVITCSDGYPEDISWLIVRAFPELKFNQKHGGITMSGAGMDMGFALTYHVSRGLYPEGFECIGGWGPGEYDRERCPANDHVNTGSKHLTSHREGGYAVKHRWI